MTAAECLAHEEALHAYADRLERTDHPRAVEARRQADGWSAQIQRWKAEADLIAVKQAAEAQVSKVLDDVIYLRNIAKANFEDLRDWAKGWGVEHEAQIERTADEVRKSQRKSVAKSLTVRRTVPVKDAKGRVTRVDVFEGDRLVVQRFPTYARDKFGLTSTILSVDEVPVPVTS